MIAALVIIMTIDDIFAAERALWVIRNVGEISYKDASGLIVQLNTR